MPADARLLTCLIRAQHLIPLLEALEDRAAGLEPGEPLEVVAASGCFRVCLTVRRLPVQPPLPGLPPAEFAPTTNDLTPLQRRVLAHVGRETQTARKILNAAGLKYSSHNRQALTDLVEMGKIEREGGKRGKLRLTPASPGNARPA